MSKGKGTSRWTHVRIDQGTKARLVAWMSRLDEAIVRGQSDRDSGRWDRVTVDQAINILLDRDMRHKARKRKYASRRATGGTTPTTGETT